MALLNPFKRCTRLERRAIPQRGGVTQRFSASASPMQQLAPQCARSVLVSRTTFTGTSVTCFGTRPVCSMMLKVSQRCSPVFERATFWRTYTASCVPSLAMLNATVGTHQLKKCVAVYGSSFNGAQLVSCLAQFLKYAKQERVSAAQLVEHPTLRLLLYHLEERLGQCDLSTLGRIAFDVLPHFSAYCPSEAASKVGKLSIAVFLEARRRVLHQTSSNDALCVTQLMTIIRQCSRYGYIFGGTLSVVLDHVFHSEMSFGMAVLCQLGYVLKDLNITKNKYLDPFFKNLALCVESIPGDQLPQFIDFLCATERWVRPGVYEAALGSMIRSSVTFHPVTYTAMIEKLCAFQYLSTSQMALLLKHLDTEQFSTSQLIHLCFAATLVNPGIPIPMSCILQTVVRAPKVYGKTLDITASVMLAYCLYYDRTPGTEAYARALLRDCLKTMTPLLRRFHRLPASQERNNAVILTELCVAMNVVNEKSLLVLDKDVKKMMYEIVRHRRVGTRFRRTKPLRLLSGVHKKRLPRMLKTLRLRTNRTIGPFQVALVDVKRKVVLNEVEGPMVTGWGLRHRCFAELGFRCCTLNLLNARHMALPQKYVASLLTQTLRSVSPQSGLTDRGRNAAVVRSLKRRTGASKKPRGSVKRN